MQTSEMAAEELNDILQDCLTELKQRCRRQQPFMYDRWKAGGFLVDDDIVTMYDNVYGVVEALTDLEICDEQSSS